MSTCITHKYSNVSPIFPQHLTGLRGSLIILSGSNASPKRLSGGEVKYLHLRPYIFIKCDGSSTPIWQSKQSWSELRLSFEQSFGVLDLDTDTEIKVTIGCTGICKLATIHITINRYTIMFVS